MENYEYKQLIDFIRKEIKDSIYSFSTEKKLDLSKTSTGKIIGGSLSPLDCGYETYTTDLEAYPIDEDTIAWGKGALTDIEGIANATIQIADGRTQEIICNSGYDITELVDHYFYVDWGNTTLQHTLNYSEAVGGSKILIFMARPSCTYSVANNEWVINTSGKALIIHYGARIPILNAVSISANSILAEHIMSDSIEARHIKAGEITADKLSFNISDYAITKSDEPPIDPEVDDLWLCTKTENGFIENILYRCTSISPITWTACSSTDLDSLGTEGQYLKIFANSYLTADGLNVSAMYQILGTEPLTQEEKDLWNSKNKITRSYSQPLSHIEGDYWIDLSNNYTYIFDGINWVSAKDGALIDLETDIAAGNINLSSSTTLNGVLRVTEGVELSATDGIIITGGTGNKFVIQDSDSNITFSVDANGSLRSNSNSIVLSDSEITINKNGGIFFCTSDGDKMGTMYASEQLDGSRVMFIQSYPNFNNKSKIYIGTVSNNTEVRLVGKVIAQNSFKLPVGMNMI
jgi:hypothetical protein